MMDFENGTAIGFLNTSFASNIVPFKGLLVLYVLERSFTPPPVHPLPSFASKFFFCRNKSIKTHLNLFNSANSADFFLLFESLLHNFILLSRALISILDFLESNSEGA